MLISAKMSIIAGFALALVSAIVPARAATPEEAKALAEKAATLVATEGEKAFATLSDPKGEFVQGELHVTVIDHQGIVRASINPKMIGVNMWDAADPDGVKFTQEGIKIGDTTGTGWQDYKFVNPLTKKIEAKRTWVHKVGDYYLQCGAYIAN